MKNKIILSLIFLFVCYFSADAQNKYPHTLTLDSLSQSPEASLADISWIQGRWKGKAFGGVTEEVWTPPLGGSMMCAFKLVVDGKVQFYELVTITEVENTLMLRLKHFHEDLKGWEEKDETIDFPLVKVTPDKVFFEGFTFEKVNDEEMNIYVRIEDKEGIREQKFNYKQVYLNK